MQVTEIYVPEREAIAITSMARTGEKLWLGLTGGAKVLASYNIKKEKIEVGPKVFPWVSDRGYCTKLHNALGALPDGSLILGEGNHFTWDGLPVTVNYFNRELPERMLARKKAQGFADVKYSDFCLESLENWDRSRSDQGGKIVQYFPDKNETKEVCRLPEYLYVQSLCVDGERGRAYGHTIPDNHFFFVDLITGKLKDFGRISTYAHHNMVVTPSGKCYGGWIDMADGALKLLRFDPEAGRLHHLNKTILQNPGNKVAGNIGIDQWIVTSKGEIYLGTVADALLFKFNEQNESFEFIAKLGRGGRVTSMDEDENGDIWIGTGYPNMSLMRFTPDAVGHRHITDFGTVNGIHERCYFHASHYNKGKLYLGETDGFSPSLHIIDLADLTDNETGKNNLLS